MIGGRTRLSLVEYGAPVDLCLTIAEATGLDRGRVTQMLVETGTRAASSLGIKANPISVDAKGARVVGVAGLIRLGPSLELEIAPKFLGLDDADARWREDFFFLSTLSRHGRLLASERMSASGGAPRDLSVLVARAFVDMYQARKRRLLRSYRRVKVTDFFIDGDPDPVDLLFPEPDGFEQEVIRFDRRNAWNGTISAAAQELLPEVSEAATAAKLTRVIEDLAPQSRPNMAIRKPIPARHHTWQPLHDLSVDVLKGLGLTYKQGQAHAPGYVVSTWKVWEDFLTIASRMAFGRLAVSAQKGVVLGSRIRPAMGGSSRKFNVVPDFVIEGDGVRPRFVLDAKYKGRVEGSALRIMEADVYEAIAFSKATGCNLVALAYPALPNALPNPPGSSVVFERVTIGHIHIIGVQVEIRGISKKGALKRFAANLSAGLLTALMSTS